MAMNRMKKAVLILRNIPTATLLATLWLLTRLPFRLQMSLGAKIGLLIYAYHKKRRHITEVNIRLCFPELNQAKQQQLIKEHFQSLGMTLFETGMAWWPKKQFSGTVKIEGINHLQEHLKQGKGVLMLGAHFTTLDIGGYLLSRQQAFCVIYREHKNPLFELVMNTARQRNFQEAIQRKELRKTIRLLKQGSAVWYAPDQNYGKDHSIFVPFFGIQTSTITTTMRIATLGNAIVIPYFTERLADRSGYRLQFLPALDNFPSGNDNTDATRINQIIEEKVREIPAQYLWTHRRFKTRPEGEKSFY